MRNRDIDLPRVIDFKSYQSYQKYNITQYEELWLFIVYSD